MMREIRRRPQVPGEIIELAQYIARDNLDAGYRFIDAVERDLLEILDLPGAGAIPAFDTPRLEGMRFWIITGFHKYLIYYCPRDYGIEVIAVVHGARDLPRLLGERA